MYNQLIQNNIQYRPIVLILDSGVGGLFIYDILHKKYPAWFYIYFFDNKFFPYGELSESLIIQRVQFIISTIFSYWQCDLVIIACNTISVVALKKLKIRFKFPIIGIVPEIKLATRYTKNGVIGVLGTYRTISHNYTLNVIKQFTNQYKIVLLDSSELVKLAESKMHGKLIFKSELKNIFKSWFSLKKFPDTIVLGCTHFSWLKKELMEIFPIDCCLIDSELYYSSYIEFYLSNYFFENNIVECYQSLNVFRKNQAFCTMYTADMIKLKSILLSQYSFFSLEVLLI